ncbi:hypothetical protein WKU33_15360 [Oceanobacillus sp. HCA-5259]|uniref:hypothetical protein n=1 Tax=Oceanobacillus sp. HCA-5259 TaxID=3134661 RepID=UPI0030C1B41C
MKAIGWAGIMHVSILIIWMVIHILFNQLNPVVINDEAAMAQTGIEFYSNFPGLLGFDHGSKAFVMLLSVLLPIGLYIHFKELKIFRLKNTIALVAGCSGFTLYGLSLMLQAVTVEYAFNLYRTTEDTVAHSFAVLLYDWAMLEGGLSVSMYILANLCLSCWVMIHSIGLFSFNSFKKIGIFGCIVGAIQIIGSFLAWFFLMQAKQNMHDFNEAIGLLFTIWIAMISFQMIRGKITIKEDRSRIV